MRALVLYYAYEGDPSQADPIAIIPEVVLENIGAEEEERLFAAAREPYSAPAEHCRVAWVDMPSGSRLFETPDLGSAQLGDQ